MYGNSVKQARLFAIQRMDRAHHGDRSQAGQQCPDTRADTSRQESKLQPHSDDVMQWAQHPSVHLHTHQIFDAVTSVRVRVQRSKYREADRSVDVRGHRHDLKRCRQPCRDQFYDQCGAHRGHEICEHNVRVDIPQTAIPIPVQELRPKSNGPVHHPMSLLQARRFSQSARRRQWTCLA